MTRPTARSYSAGSAVNAAQGPLDWGDKCFLCSSTINIDTPPVDSREFYVSKKGGMYLCHSGCVAEMDRAGGTPKDFHQARAARGEAVTPKAPEPETHPPQQMQGSGWLHFGTVADYNAYVRGGTEIDEDVKITIGDGYHVLQAGA